MHFADDPKVDAISAGINLRRTGTKRILSRLDVQILIGIGQSSAIRLMKSTHHCFRIANQYFVMEEDLFDYFKRVCKTSGWKLVNLWLVAVESKSTHPTIFLTAGAAIIQPLI